MTPERNNPSEDLTVAERHSSLSPIEKYIDEFSLDWHRDLKPKDLLVFFAARRLEKLITDIKVPVGKTPAAENALMQKTTERKIHNTRYQDDEALSAIYANSMDIGLVRRLEDIKDALLS